MKKITYIILSLCLCTAGVGTAAHLSPNVNLDDLTAINDTIDEEDVQFDEEEDEEDDETEYDAEEGEEDEDEFDEEEEDEDEEGEYEEEEEEDDEGFFTQEEQDEFGEMHDDYDAIDDTLAGDIILTEGMRVNAEEQMKSYNATNYLSSDSTKYEFKEANAELYIDRLRRMPVVMEMPYNDIVRKYIDQYANRMQRSVSIMLGAQNFYNPIFEQALEAEGIPLELKYLPVIESAYNPMATSPVGAAGLWQFMPATGQQYGLQINSLVDERRDPIKSSHAAARLLKYLYKYYEDWSLVIAAYNCGPGNVNKAIQRAGGVKDYWAIYNYLPSETRGYVPAFIAANYVMTYYCEHGITPMQAKLPAETDTIVVSRDLHLRQIAELCDVNIDQLKELNPQYRTQVVPGYWKPCAVRLPVEAVSKFIACGDSIYTHRASELLPRRSVAMIGKSNATTATTNTAVKHTTTTSYTRPRTTNYGKTNSYNKGYNNTYNRNGYNRSNTGYKKPSTYNKTNSYNRGGTYTKKTTSTSSYNKKAPVKNTTSKSSYNKKAPVKNSTSKNSYNKKAPVKNTTSKSSYNKKAPAKNTTSKNSYNKKAPAKKAPAKKAPVKKAPAKKSSSKKR